MPQPTDPEPPRARPANDAPDTWQRYRLARRRAHLQQPNLLRSLTEVINAVPGGINLGQGVCDMDSPSPLRAGAIASIDGADRQTYTHYAGVPELRAAIARKLRDWNGLDVDPDGVMVATGSSGAFFAAVLTLFDDSDEVLLFEPFYPYHASALALAGVWPIPVPLRGPAYELDVDALARAISSSTRAIVLNTPANPSGKVFDAAELEAIARVLQGTNVLVLTDEVYEYMCYDGRRHVSPATVPGLRDRTVTIGGFSKTFSITGWRIGYLAGPPAIVDAIGKVFDQINVCAARPLQRGVERALRELPASFYGELQATYQRKRDQFCGALEEAGFALVRPQGAYYVLADYRRVLGDVDPHAAVLRMIERVGVSGVPGHVFHASAEGVRTIRFHFAVTAKVLDEACRRLRALGRDAAGTRG